MKKLLIILFLLGEIACSEVDTLTPLAYRNTQARIGSFEAQLRFTAPQDNNTRPLDGATLKAGVGYRIFTDLAAVRWDGEQPFKCLFWLDSVYTNRENVTPYDFKEAKDAKGLDVFEAGEYTIKIRCYYGTQGNVIYQQEDAATFMVIDTDQVTPAANAYEDDTVFFEGFDGPLDTRFSTRFYWSWDADGGQAGFNQYCQWFKPENVEIRNGKAHLMADNVPYTKTVENRGTFPYTGAVLSTHDSSSQYDFDPQSGFEFQYGTVEVRLQLPQGNSYGMWPAIWLLTSDDRWPPEIDILEVLGEEPNTAQFHVHYKDENGKHQQYGQGINIDGLSQGYHTYRLRWTPDELVWYVDKKERYRVTNKSAIPDVPLHLIINNAVSSGKEGSWGKAPTGETTFPNKVSIDWVRITQ